MRGEPVIRPLSIDENIYALCDETGKTIGTGTREVCEVLLYMIVNSDHPENRRSAVAKVAARKNVRAAITI